MSEVKTKKKRILFEEGNIRIKEYDAMNVIIERLETYYSPKEEKEISAWRFKGYSPNVLGALRLIHIKRWMDDINAHSSVKSLLESMLESDRRVVQAIKEATQ